MPERGLPGIAQAPRRHRQAGGHGLGLDGVIRGLAIVVLCALPATARPVPPQLALPVDCMLGESCHIQQTVDRDPGPGAQDYACGSLSYDGHNGTDFRLNDRAAMRRGVDVLAAADGTVRATRDGMADAAQDGKDPPDVDGRDCGNGVVLVHDGGWETQYCHMRRGSIAVREGETVRAGTPLGRIGLSGRTAFPHLHLSVRNPAGEVVDPFDGAASPEGCGAAGSPLWADPAIVEYVGGGLLTAGFASEMPPYISVREGTAALERIPASSPAIVFWAHFFGLREGDELSLALRDPSGAVLAEERHRMDRNRATQFRGIGRRNRDARWPAGRYGGEARLLREGRQIAGFETSVEVVP